MVVAVVVVATLYFAKVVLIPFALAVLLTFVLTPFVRMLERIWLGRVVSTLLVVLLAVVAVSALGWTVGLQFSQVMNELPHYRTNIKNKIDSLHWTRNETINNASNTMNEISKELVAPPAHGAAGESRPAYEASRQRPLPVRDCEATEPAAGVRAKRAGIGGEFRHRRRLHIFHADAARESA